MDHIIAPSGPRSPSGTASKTCPLMVMAVMIEGKTTDVEQEEHG